MDFIFGISNYVLGNISLKDIPNIATQALIEGFDTSSLRILAGLRDNNPWEIDQYLSSSLKELNLKIPNNEEAGLNVIIYYLNKIVGREIDPILGIEKCIYEVLYKVRSFSGSKRYAFDKIEFHCLYGLFYEYDDMMNPLVLVSDNYRKKRICKIKDEIIEESNRYLQNINTLKDKVLNDQL